MTDKAIVVDQFVAAAPEQVWRVLTEPELLGRWWAPGDIAPVVGHKFQLQMPKWGEVVCEVTHVDAPTRLTYTFNSDWTLDWRLAAEGRGTRLFLEHSGFDLDNPQHRNAFERMGPGWRDTVLPKLAVLAAELT